MDYRKYLKGREVYEIKLGKSGAEVYEIDGKTILKHVVRQDLKNDMFDAYKREALFYREKLREKPAYLPEVLEAEISEDEIIILMRKYKVPDRSKVNNEMIRKIAYLLAGIHCDEIPEFMAGDEKKAEAPAEERIEYCLKGWKSVLAEHPGVFDDTPLTDISRDLNRILEWHAGEDRLLIHGDFHWENLLEDNDGQLLVCDWQGVCTGGGSADISFFMSRSAADGIVIDESLFLQAYSEAIKELGGRSVNAEDIRRHMAASNILTTFEFWHEYLHGNDADRVKGIYEKMLDDHRKWAAGGCIKHKRACTWGKFYKCSRIYRNC